MQPSRKLLAFSALVACHLAAVAQAPSRAALSIPANQSIRFVLHARGVQIYIAKATDGGATTFEWALKGPEAGLFNTSGKKVGKHYAGPNGPRWQLGDGSMIEGKKQASTAASSSKDIPWLLLSATQVDSKSGGMDGIDYVMRVNTVGGISPTEPPTKAGQEFRVNYEAIYVFLEQTAAR